MCPRGLNEEQRRAVLIQEDRTLIVARAETGKTHTMVEKARDTVRTGIASPSDIAFVTFTRKAAQEICSRSTDLEGMEVGTLHDLARLMIEMAKGRRPRLSPLAEDDGARLENIEAWLVEAVDTSRPALTRETTADTAGLTARIIARVAGIWWLLPVLVLLALALGPGSFSEASEAVAAKGGKTGTSAETESPCMGACGPRRLARGETVCVTVAARRMRNETGLLLARGETYTARFIESDGWRDGNYDVEPNGVEFEGWNRYLAKGVEWLRPYPQGAWFQLIGRIDRGRDVFPIFNQQGEPLAFRAPEDGEFVLLVNDVIYGNNGGFLTVEVSVDSDS